MDLLVIGRSGQVAQSLAARAGARGDVVVTLLGRPTLDLSALSQLECALGDRRPDALINAAAYTNVDGAESDKDAAFALNAEAPAALASWAHDRGVPFVHLSTDYVFDGVKGTPYKEIDTPAPIGVYGASKLAGEQNVARANPDAIIVRTAWVYSPYGKNFVKTMLRLATDRDAVSVVADQRGRPTSALDIADGVIDVCLEGIEAGGVYHMCGEGEATWADLAEAAFAESARLGGPSARVERIPSSAYPTPAKRPANSRLDCAKLEEVFGVVLPDWRASVKACVAQILENAD